MRHGNVGTWILALTVSLASASGVRADEDEGWWARHFRRPGTQKPKEPEPPNQVLARAPVSAEARRKQALDNWTRRQEVCQRLREIAAETHDRELSQKADQLDQRAYDTYVQQTANLPTPGLSATEATVQRHMAPSSASSRGRILQVDSGSTRSGQQARASSQEGP